MELLNCCIIDRLCMIIADHLNYFSFFISIADTGHIFELRPLKKAQPVHIGHRSNDCHLCTEWKDRL